MPRPPSPGPRTAPAARDAASPRGGIGRAVLHRLPLAGTLAGLGLGLWLVATNDLGAIATAFGRVGIPGLLAVVLVRIGVVGLCGFAWARILDRLGPTGPGPFVVLRFVREGINVLLPVASVGGEVVGGRLLTFWGVSGALAAASLLADMLIQVSTQLVFALTGVALLRQVEAENAAALAAWGLKAAGVALAVLALFFAVQRFGPAGSIERRLSAIGRRFVRAASPAPASGSTGSVQAALDAVWAVGRRGRLAQCFVLHLAAWGLGAAEIWIALTCLGIGASIQEVVVLEALSQAIKSAAFPVPSGLGVQEGGFVVLGALFGIDADTAIALSLVKRVPDVVLGLPSLLVWQNLEARRGTVLAPPG